MTLQESIWNAAEFVCEWDKDGLRYKLYRVPRHAIDEESDEADAWLLHGIDVNRVRQVDVLIDEAYSREYDREACLKALPADAADDHPLSVAIG